LKKKKKVGWGGELSKASDQEIPLKNPEESQNGEIDLAIDF